MPFTNDDRYYEILLDLDAYDCPLTEEEADFIRDIWLQGFFKEKDRVIVDAMKEKYLA